MEELLRKYLNQVSEDHPITYLCIKLAWFYGVLGVNSIKKLNVF